jgi:AcrR family transcriptional regulator
MMSDKNQKSSVVTKRVDHMNIRARLSPDETRLRIMEVAEEHFRRVGYAKTAVADIAEALGMSSANVYRYFASKSAIKDAICYRLLKQEHAMIEEIIASPEPAAVRLERIIIGINRYNRCQFVKEKRLHDMVEVAMAENWEAVKAHCDKIKGYYATVIAEGVAAGEFAPLDPVATAEGMFLLCVGLCHPAMIAQNNDENAESNARQAVALVIRSLRP